MNAKTFAIAGLLALPVLALAQTPTKPAPAPKPATPTPGSTISTTPTAAAAPAPSAPAVAVAVAARVALVTGSVTATTAGGTSTLKTGDAVYEGQTVTVGPNSYANLKFADGGRVLLRPNTVFAVEQFRYSGPEPAETPKSTPAPAAVAPKVNTPSQGSAFFRLVRGGFRAVSGLLGKANRQDYRVTTPAATIGIRGTDYEVQMCTTDCPSTAGTADRGGVQVASSSLAGLQLAQGGGPPPGGDAGGGIVVATNDGSVSLRTSRGEFVVDVGQVMLALNNGQTFVLPIVPDVLLQNATPSPEACE